MDAAYKACLRDGVEIIQESYPECLPATVRIGTELARLNIDSLPIRDLFSTMARCGFCHYADPAGLIAALQINDATVKPSQIYIRWQTLVTIMPELTNQELLGLTDVPNGNTVVTAAISVLVFFAKWIPFPTT